MTCKKKLEEREDKVTQRVTNYNLFIDKEGSLLFDNNGCQKLFLMPGLDSSLGVKMESKNYLSVNSGLVKLNNSIASSFAKHIYSGKLNLDPDASRFLYYGFGTAISFLLGDRIIRINELLGVYDKNQIKVPCPAYNYNKSISHREFYFDEVERNPIFNQWIVANILSEQKVERTQNSSILEVKIFIDLKKLRKKIATFCYMMLHTFSSRLFALNIRDSHRSQKAPFFSFGYLSDLFNDSDIIREMKSLIELPAYLPIWGNFFKKDLIRTDSKSLVNEVSNLFKRFIDEESERNNLPEYVYKNLAKLVISLQPNAVNRDLIDNTQWALNIFSKFNNDYYLTDTTTSNPLSCLYLFAARTFKLKVISCQHSAWGGYFANGSLVSENLILGAHYYITFGWNEPDRKLSFWEIDNYNLPSPLLSKMRGSLSENTEINKDRKTGVKKILLCPGFLNRFPSIYNSSLRLDVIDSWRDIICDIIKTCIQHGFKVELKFYNNKFNSDFKVLKELWLSLGSPEEICEYKDHDSRVRNILSSDDYDFIIWDLPAGGFSECLTVFHKTIALSSPILHEYYPSDNKAIEELISCGLLFQDSFELARTLVGINNDSQWFNNSYRLQAVDNFQKKHTLIDPDWEIKWKNFILKLLPRSTL